MILIPRLNFFLKQILLATVLALTPTALSAEPKHLADNGDWAAYENTNGKGKICFAITEPKKKLPKKVSRDPVYFLITNRPKEKIKNEVSIITGYPYKADSITTVQIGDDKFELYTKADGAWIDNAKAEKRLIKSMKNGNTMIVKGTSRRGTVTTDEYSLIGITKTISVIDKACK